MICLEKYSGKSSRHTCPSCGHSGRFVRYVIDGEYISDEVGRCNRESSCGYHLPPREFWAMNPNLRMPASPKRRSPSYLAKPLPSPDYIGQEHLLRTLGNYQDNALVEFLFDLFPNEQNVWSALEEYSIGTFPDPYGAYTCFPYLDQEQNFCRGKLIRFNAETGRRMKGDFDTSSIVSKLRLTNFNYKQILFGEHLLARYPNSPIGVVEAEKTAVIASICKDTFPDLVWLAAGSKQWLNPGRLVALGKDRTIILYPDGDAYGTWQSIANQANRSGANISVSSLIETYGTEEEKRSGHDLADYLVRQQFFINEQNSMTQDHRNI